MTIDVQYKIKSNINYQRYLRENPIWYKKLNRDPRSFRQFILEMKDRYELKPTDKLNKLFNNIAMLQNFLDVLK